MEKKWDAENSRATCHRQREKGDLNWIRFKCHAVKQNVTQIEFQPKQNLLLFYLFVVVFVVSNKENERWQSSRRSSATVPLNTFSNQTCENDTQIVSSSCLNWIIWHQPATSNGERSTRPMRKEFKRRLHDVCKNTTPWNLLHMHRVHCLHLSQGQQQENVVF